MHDLTSTCDPVGLYQAGHHLDMAMMLGYYHARTPGTWLAIQPSVQLRSGDRIQPHLAMLVASGSRRRFDLAGPEGLAIGTPQLAVEIRWWIDDAEEERRTGILAAGEVEESLVWRIHTGRVTLYRRAEQVAKRVQPDAQGVLKSAALPGLWLSPAIILGGEGQHHR